ncbi:MAG: hypothetical protein J6Y26_03220 [Lachnospiraceae bacterium]|nr:hypothetical protein [Lachnospiraceae bacterium]
MKCRALEIKADMGIAKVMRVYGVQSLEAIEAESAELLLGAFPWFRRSDRLSEFYQAQADTLGYYMERNAADHVYVNGRNGRREATAAEAFEDTINGTIWNLTRDLKDAGFDAEAIFDKAVAYMPEHSPIGDTAKIQSEARISWYAYNGRDAVKTWIGSSALALREMTYPSGQRRFSVPALTNKLLLPLAEFISGWLTDWFSGTDAADRRLRKQHREQLRRIEATYGFQVMALDERETDGYETIRKAPPEKPQKKAPAPFPDAAKYEALLKESMKMKL